MPARTKTVDRSKPSIENRRLATILSSNPERQGNLFAHQYPGQSDVQVQSASGDKQIGKNDDNSRPRQYLFDQDVPLSPDQLVQIVTEEFKKHLENKALVVAVENILDRADKLVGWSIEDRSMEQLFSWHLEYSGGPQKIETVYDKINAAERHKIELEDHQESLQALKEELKKGIEEVSSISSPIQDDRLLPEIQKIADPTLLHAVAIMESYNWRVMQETLRRQAAPQKNKIDTSLKETKKHLREATETYEYNKRLKPPGHPFFPKEEMITTYATIEPVKKGRNPGASMVTVLRNLIEAQPGVGVGTTDENRFAQTLGLHPIGGGIDLTQLPTILPFLGDTKGLQFWTIQRGSERLNPPLEKYNGITPWWKWSRPSTTAVEAKRDLADLATHLKTALGAGPIGAILDNAQKVAKPEHRLEHPVTIYRLDQDSNDNFHVAILDELEDKPYTISLSRFAEVFTGGVILPHAALLDLQASMPPTS